MLRLPWAVCRSQAALAPDRKERGVMTGESDNNRRREARRAEGVQDAGPAVQMRVHLRKDPEPGRRAAGRVVSRVYTPGGG
jgi:hypothetical protein